MPGQEVHLDLVSVEGDGTAKYLAGGRAGEAGGGRQEL